MKHNNNTQNSDAEKSSSSIESYIELQCPHCKSFVSINICEEDTELLCPVCNQIVNTPQIEEEKKENENVSKIIPKGPVSVLMMLLIVSSILIIFGFFSTWGGIYCRGNVDAYPNCKLKFLSTKAESINIRFVENTYKVSIPPFSDDRIIFNVGVTGGYLISIPITGKDAGIVGYFLLTFGILIGFMGLLSNRNSKLFMLTTLIVIVFSIISLLILFIIRTDNSVINSWGSIGYAIEHSDYTLGFPNGPILCIMGFLLGLIISIQKTIQINKLLKQ